MTFEYRLLSCQNYSSFFSHLNNAQVLQIKLDPNFAWEKIKIGAQEEYFNLEKVTLHINKLSTRRNLSENEIRMGKDICNIFERLWEQVDEEVKTLNCTSALFYKIIHYPSSSFYSGWNPAWIDFWSSRSIVLKRSWGVFSARQNLSSKE